MFRLLVTIAVFWVGVVTGISGVACLWDRDTLAMERQRFPTALELITGKFLRHSEDFYRWRITDRNERIALEPSADLYDDLAVAYEKIGATEAAIRSIKKKGELYPGLYSTHANLGTFYFHSGEYELGLVEIDKALAINPEAHFGRERYQKLLVEYIAAQQDGEEIVLPLANAGPSGTGPVGFGAFLVEKNRETTGGTDDADAVDAGLIGVLGMMKFGNFDSPVLLEALADLLVSRGFDSDAKRLAARAYLKASYETKSKVAEVAYRKKAEQCLQFQAKTSRTHTRLSLGELEKQFRSEVNEAALWYEGVVAKEKTWLKEGVDVEKAFEREFYSPPVVAGPVVAGLRASDSNFELSVPSVVFAAFVCTAICGVPFLLLRQKNKRKAATG